LQIDWTHFTPLPALGGGLLIGLAAAWLLLTQGRILGAAGVLAGLVNPGPGQWLWRLALVAGLIAAAPLAILLFGVQRPVIESPAALLIVAGLLVGAGSRLANGCTSGHGVCGLARLSPRSAAATATFMASGFLVVFIVRHVLG
jgi:uncharacterized membrane protein YedE/YeeE